MKFIKPSSLPNLFQLIEPVEDRKYYLAGGTDLNVQIRNGTVSDGTIIFINHLTELRGIRKVDDKIMIGALSSYREILHSETIAGNLSFFHDSLRHFAAPALQTMATIGGNIANGSPTADVLPLLLVLDAEMRLLSKSKFRDIPLAEFFTAYKQNILKRNEIIGAVLIPVNAEKGFNCFYRKIGSRRSLTIAKIALAGLKMTASTQISAIKIAVGAVNEYPRRLLQIEEFLKGNSDETLDDAALRSILRNEITPISDLRSDSDYRFEVCFNLLREFIRQ